MRPAFVKPLASATVAVLFALVSTNGALAEDAQIDDVEADGTQIVAVGAADDQLPAKNLNTVPLDGFGFQVGAGSSPLIRQLTAARPNEDLVICLAGCFSGRDRVVYAQPIDRQALAKTASSAATGASDGTSGSIPHGLRGSQ